MFVIPSKETKKFSQPNYGDTQGNLWGTFNVDLTKNTGRVRVSRTEIITDSTDDADLKLTTAFAFFDPTTNNDPVFVAYAGKVFFGGADPIQPFVQDTLTNSPTDTSNYGDMVVFNDKLYATEATKLKSLTHGASAWTDVTTLTSGVHQMCVYKDKLYYVDQGLKLFSVDSDGITVNITGNYTLNLSYLKGHISWIKAGSNRIWIGVTSNDGTRGIIFEWDGQSENLWSKNYIIEAQGSAGCTLWNDVPYVLDIEGRLLAFNGSGFEEVARLPLMQYDALNRTYASSQSTKICHFNGIRFMNDAILMFIETGNTSAVSLENFPSGIYEYTKENGITHRFSPTLSKFSETARDYGQLSRTQAGAIFDATARFTNVNDYYASVFYGALTADETFSGSVYSIGIDMIYKSTNDVTKFRQGHIITPFLESTKIKDVWNKVYIKYRKFLDSDAKIMVKYRTRKDEPIIAQRVEWNSPTELVSTAFQDVVAGMEMEVLNGNGGGDIAHVVSNTYDGVSDYTVVLNKAIVGVSATDISDVRFQTWKELPTISYDDNQFKELTIPQYNKDTEMQIKIVMNWDKLQNELREIIVVNETDQYAK